MVCTVSKKVSKYYFYITPPFFLLLVCLFGVFFRTLKCACLFYLLQYFNVLDEGHQLYGDDKTIILSIYSVLLLKVFKNKAFNANIVTD